MRCEACGRLVVAVAVFRADGKAVGPECAASGERELVEELIAGIPTPMEPESTLNVTSFIDVLSPAPKHRRPGPPR
jgi:hypothetical protein